MQLRHSVSVLLVSVIILGFGELSPVVLVSYLPTVFVGNVSPLSC